MPHFYLLSSRKELIGAFSLRASGSSEGLLNDLSSIVKSVPRPDRSRAALIETAGTLFRRQGYAATGLQQILDEAGVKAGSLYHHFPGGKRELGAAAVDVAGAQIGGVL